MPYFGQEILIESQSKGPLTDERYRKALATARALSRAQGIDAALAKDRLDALVAPTGPLPWMIDYANGDHASGGCTQMPAVCGLSAHHGARGIRLRIAGRHLVFRAARTARRR